MTPPETPDCNSDAPGVIRCTALLGVVVESGGCISTQTDGSKHAEMDAYGKANGMTVVFAPWHPNPEYRIFKTGSLASRNEKYPSGLVIVNERCAPQPWQAPNVPVSDGATKDL